MRDFQIIKDVNNASESYQKRISNFLRKTFSGVGVIQQGVTIINLKSASAQYKKFITESCEFDCYIITPEILKDNQTIRRLELILLNLQDTKRKIKFVNIYDAKNNYHVNNTFRIMSKFLANNMIHALYNMDINEYESNISYFRNLENYYLKLKSNTEIKISNMINFLKQYDSVMQFKEEYTAKHGRAVCKFALEIGKKLKLSKAELRVLAIGAALHDIGKYEVDLCILTKKIKLSESEFRQIKDHPLIGKSILDTIVFTELSESDNETIELIVEEHHERYDGNGYPRELDYSNIHPFSMIVSIADAFHAMLGRCYQNSQTREDIIKDIIDNSGKQFSPKYVEVFCNMLYTDLEQLGLSCSSEGYLTYISKESIAQLITSI